jgi:hypothetical protein
VTTTLDLGIVADRFCPTSRTYLTYLAEAGYRVKLVLLVDFAWGWQDPGCLGLAFARWGAKRRKQAFKLPEPQHEPTFRAVCSALQAGFAIPVNYFDPFDFGRAAQSVERLTVTGYGDPDLENRLTRGDVGTWLYTNGDRVGDALLSTPGFRMLHIHPGVVPFFKGSDGLLWSTLINGRPGMSCFYMNAGIDTGDIIATREFDLPRFSRLDELKSVPQDALYRGLLSAYDPHLRASMLLDVVGRHVAGKLNQLPCTRQSPDDGRSFFWMHDALKAIAIRRLLGLSA